MAGNRHRIQLVDVGNEQPNVAPSIAAGVPTPIVSAASGRRAVQNFPACCQDPGSHINAPCYYDCQFAIPAFRSKNISTFLMPESAPGCRLVIVETGPRECL
jgi:hypothetical protein